MEEDLISGPFSEAKTNSHYSNDSVIREIDYTQNDSKLTEWIDPKGRKMIVKLLPTVYPPRKDTDIIANHIVKIGANDGNFLEIGSGSGVLSILAANMGWNSHACEINPFAVACTIENSKQNNAAVKTVEGGPGPKEEEASMNWWHNKKHDLIVWNLPYIRMKNLPEKTLGPLEESALIDNDDLGIEKRVLNQIMEKDILSRDGIIMLLGKVENSNSLVQHANSLGLAARTVEKVSLEDGDSLGLTKIWQPWVKSDRMDYETIESTNEEMLSKDSVHGEIITAKHQENGRGRGGNKWASTSKCIAATWHLNHNGENLDPFFTQLAAGYVVNSVLSSLTKSNTMLKWPNDIYASDGLFTGKLGGILVEGRSKGNYTKIVCGVGVNLELLDFERKTDYPIIGLSDLVGKKVERSVLITSLNAAMASVFESKHNVEKLDHKSMMADISSKIKLDAKSIGNCFLEDLCCEVVGLSEKGELKMKMPNGELRNIDEPRQIEWQFNN